MDERGYYGEFGGAFIPEILVATFDELSAAFAEAKAIPASGPTYEQLMSNYSCRPTPLTYCRAADEALRRRADLHQARGPQPHQGPTRPTT